MSEIFWHNLKIEEVVKALRSNIKDGLSIEEVKIRQKELGLNKLPEDKTLPSLKIFLEQFRSPLIYILVIAGITTLILREYTDTIVIFGAVFFNTIVGFIQENKSSKTLRALKKVVKYESEVLRDGNLKIINSEELVVSDIMVLNPGDKVSADGRIIDCRNLEINEMALTGEWLAAKKKSEALSQETSLADRDNMVYMGTIVENGKGRVIVTETGTNTEIGKIAMILKETKEGKTPYQKKLANFSKTIGIIIGIICFGIFIEGMIIGGKFIEIFTTSIAIAVAAIPEGLPVSMTVILSLGMQKILQKKGLVRKLVAAETMGSTSIIATDKTATLTEGKMKVDEVMGNKFLILKAAILTSEAFIENIQDSKEKWIIRGRPTDKALLEAGIEAGINRDKDFEKRKIAELPFSPKNKISAVLYEENNEKILYVCGAPEIIMNLSILNEKERKDWEKKLEELAQKGLRVIASAYQKIENRDSKIENLQDLCKDLIFTGFITLKDPIRPEVKEAMKICREAGMKPIIVTGDHKLTAKAVAEELGFIIKEENILEGKDLDKLSDIRFKEILNKIQIYARVEPRHKFRIIEAWQSIGQVIAMVGDGINDAPALKRADIGVAIGSGTEVAKEASDLILLDDSFSIIVAAVEEGRVILDNIRKVITYLLSDSFTEVILIAVSLFFGFPLPLTAAQILWVNLIEDGLPGIALAFEPKEEDIMKRKPTCHKTPLLTREMKTLIVVIGLVTDLLLLALFVWLIKYSGYEISHIRSVIFAGLAIDSLFFVFSCKSLRKNIWQINILSNKLLIISFIFGMMMLIVALYLPIFQNILKTVPLNLFDWQLILGLGILDIALIELTKWYFITKKEYD
ncbi:HAD-IC family P-type ATPase [Patescibacteria group bacterium]|nr:HAD-IC family P-type ATPase [Patescibacteria group bacterium]